MKAKSALACVGVIVHDDVYHVDRLPHREGKFFAVEAYHCGGGMAATAAVAAASLGADASFFGRVGDDARADDLFAGLANAGVDARGVKRIPGARTSHSAVLIDAGGDRMIINYSDASLAADAAWLPAAEFARVDAVLADVRWHEGALLGLEAARRAGRIGLLDADVSTDPRMGELIAAATHAVFSAPAARELTGAHEIETALRRMQRRDTWVAVTAGADGAYWIADNHLHHIEAPRIVARSTLGAGDVFHGALALAFAEQLPTEAALHFATAAAAIKCTRDAGWAGMPSRNDVEELLSSAHRQP